MKNLSGILNANVTGNSDEFTFNSVLVFATLIYFFKVFIKLMEDLI
jgi:hypothetical protein